MNEGRKMAQDVIGMVAALATERALRAEWGRELTEAEVAAELSAMTNRTLAVALSERGVKVNIHEVEREIREYGN